MRCKNGRSGYNIFSFFGNLPVFIGKHSVLIGGLVKGFSSVDGKRDMLYIEAAVNAERHSALVKPLAADINYTERKFEILRENLSNWQKIRLTQFNRILDFWFATN